MLRALLFGMVLALIFLAAGWRLHDQEAPPAVPTPAEVAELARADALAAQTAEIDSTFRPWVAASKNIAFISVLGLFPLAVVILGMKGRRWAGVHTPRRSDGALPFRDADLRVEHAEAALAGKLQTALAAASNTGVPASLTYSPSTHARNDAAPTLEPVRAELAVPTFAELLATGAIGKDRPLYLGMGEQGPLTGTWKSIYSAGIGGLQGSGKTWTAVSMLLQALIGGVRVYVIDPHDGDEESLGTRLNSVRDLLGAPVASSEREIERIVDTVVSELERRKAGSPNREHILLAVDEWTAIQRGELGKKVALAMESISQEGRKYNVFAQILGQRWSHTRGGGNDLRNTLTSAFIHRMRREDARMLTGRDAGSLPQDTLSLAPGECYVLDTSGQQTKVATPRMSPDDVDRVRSLLAGGSSPGSTREVLGKYSGSTRESASAQGAGSTREVAGKQPGSSPEVLAGSSPTGRGDPMYAEVTQLLQAGWDIGKVRDKLAGKHVTSGRDYTAAQARLQAIIQAALLASHQAEPENDLDELVDALEDMPVPRCDKSVDDL